jgi:ATP-dependent Lon protease
VPPEKIINQEEKITVVSSREQILARIASLKEGSIEKRKAEQEFSKLMVCNEQNSDYFESYDYLVYLLNMPWTKTDTLKPDLSVSEQILNNSHWGLGKVKERILEFLAVVRQSDAAKTPILCLAGAPGVGKTSLGESIAKAVGRKFIKFSLGGVYDSATVKGHMRTYRGSSPGLIMQAIQQAGSKNPVMLLDEIDKMGGSVRLKDVESTLLELLDPKQNHNFTDHFLAVPFDLSQIMFITTANNIDDISAPLRDRLEVINIDSYTPNEKLQIAKVHIIPQIIANYKMDKDKIIFTDEGIQAIINLYTMEAGVRNLERSVETILRKILKASLTGSAKPVKITPKTLIKYLGAAPFNNAVETGSHIGRILGLSSGSQGGNIVHIEAVKAQGSGKIQYTGFGCRIKRISRNGL